MPNCYTFIQNINIEICLYLLHGNPFEINIVIFEYILSCFQNITSIFQVIS